MKSMLLYSLGILIFVCGISAQKCHMKNIDACVIPSSLKYCSDFGNVVPTDNDEFDEVCKDLIGMRGCLHHFIHNCTTSMQRELLSLIFRNISLLMNEFCTKGSYIRTRFLYLAPCIRVFVVSNEFRTIVSDILVALDMFPRLQEGVDRFDFACCAYMRLRNADTLNLSQKCGMEVVQFFKMVRTRAFYDIGDRICERFDPESTLCKNLLPLSGTKLNASQSDLTLIRALGQCLPI